MKSGGAPCRCGTSCVCGRGISVEARGRGGLVRGARGAAASGGGPARATCGWRRGAPAARGAASAAAWWARGATARARRPRLPRSCRAVSTRAILQHTKHRTLYKFNRGRISKQFGKVAVCTQPIRQDVASARAKS